jgi:mRNA-degrading endonuclease toxin of MazEF toxin-antitoxin module
VTPPFPQRGEVWLVDFSPGQASMVNLAQVLTIDKARLRRRLGIMPPESLIQVDAAIRVSLEV